MTNTPQRRPVHVDHSWLLAAWGVPMAVAVVITVVTAGFGVIAIPVALVIGLVATGLHLGARG
ncbi:hypothetical protein [Actinophytocola sp. KF-1]